MILKEQLKASTRLASLLVLLSVLVFSESTLTHADTRKPADRETIRKSSASLKRKISFQEARQRFVIADFLNSSNPGNTFYSQLHVECLALIKLDDQDIINPELLKTDRAIQLYAPRSADIILL